MKLLSLEKLKNFNLIDLIKPRILRFIWSAILDEKTCQLCLELDKKIMDVNNSDVEFFRPPLHPRCRCHLIPITSDAEYIPDVDWIKPDSDMIERFAPFLFLIPIKEKKEGIAEIVPYIPDIPEIEVDSNDIIPIWDSSEAEQQIDEFEKEELILVLFLGKTGKIILEKEVLINEELELTNREIELIKEKAIGYIISEDNDIIEDEIRRLFRLKKRYI